MKRIDLVELASFAESILHTAADMSLQYFYESLQMQKRIDYKADESPVTDADRDIEQYLRKAIAEHFPEHGIIGEEFENTWNKKSNYTWIIDPIDGTLAFTHGTPLFTNLLALFDFEQMRPVLGCISIPILKKVIYAISGKGAWDGKHRLFIEKEGLIEKERANLLFLSYDWGKVQEKSPEITKNIIDMNIPMRTWADAFAYYLLASSKAAAVIDPSTHVWDIAAVYPIVKEAGGIMRTWQGENIDWQKVLKANSIDILACSGPEILETLVDIL